MEKSRCTSAESRYCPLQFRKPELQQPAQDVASGPRTDGQRRSQKEWGRCLGWILSPQHYSLEEEKHRLGWYKRANRVTIYCMLNSARLVEKCQKLNVMNGLRRRVVTEFPLQPPVGPPQLDRSQWAGLPICSSATPCLPYLPSPFAFQL